MRSYLSNCSADAHDGTEAGLGTTAWKWIDSPADNHILRRLRLYDPADFDVIALRRQVAFIPQLGELIGLAFDSAGGAGSAYAGSRRPNATMSWQHERYVPTKGRWVVNSNNAGADFLNYPSARSHASATSGQSSPCPGFRAQADGFAQLAVRALLVVLGAGSACSGSGPATTATNPAAGDLQLAGDVTGLSSNSQVDSTHLSSPLPASQGGTGTSSAAANTVLAGPTSGSAAAPGFRALTLSDLPNISPGYILGNATASAMAPSAVMGTCTPALMSTTNTAAQNVAAYTTAARIALTATFGNVCLPPGILPFATVRLTQTFSGVHAIGALPTQTFSTNQPSLGYTLTGGTILQGKRGRIRTGFHLRGPRRRAHHVGERLSH